MILTVIIMVGISFGLFNIDVKYFDFTYIPSVSEDFLLHKTIGGYAAENYLGATDTEEITFSFNITQLGDGLFTDCTNLKKIVFTTLNPPKIGGNVFADGCQAVIIVPAAALNDYKTSNGWTEYADRIYADSVTVNYNSRGGNAIASETYEYREEIVLPTPLRIGYFFTGWYVDINLTSIFESEIAPLADTALYAGWEAISYTVVLDANGGETETNSVSLLFGSEFELPVPVKTAYDFAGWYLSGGNTAVRYTDNSGESVISWNIANNSILHARWTLVTYSISYELDGGILTDGGIESYNIESNITLQLPFKNGYIFTGWTGEGLVEPVKEAAIQAGNYGNRIYTANWLLCPVVLLKNIEEAGETEWLAFSSNVGDTVTIGAATNTGYTWLGWYDGDTKVSEDEEILYTFTMPSESITLYAKWTIKQYTISFDSNEGSAISPI
ncbi:MAG: hypothetical protein EOM87_09540, partial [Clostridia bacterium]|nr:hypothetical protein [Clostridia bacterium]